jgi:signal transduction histidine kinase
VKSRSLGVIFFAAVIVPSSLLGVLSIRSAGREEAYIERDRATTMDGEVAHVADLANAEVERVVEDLRAGVTIAPGADPARPLAAWKKAHPLVSVPFLLSPRYGILWPSSNRELNSDEKRFLKENGDFLSDKTATAVLENIAIRYQAEILARTMEKTKKAGEARAEQRAAPQPAPAEAEIDAAAADTAAGAAAPGAAAMRGAADAEATKQAGDSSARQVALDSFKQSPALQKKVYEEAQTRGDTMNARVVEPAVAAQQDALPAPAQKQPSQFVVTSQLLSQIASQGEAGIIPRFIGEKLVFLFWSRQSDGRIAGCEIAAGALRTRLAGIVKSTYTPLRILTLLDENGSPLAAPPDLTGINWHKPFVSQEIGESLPRWEAAAYLTDPNAIHAQARSSSLVIWVLVVILFVSVAGGGTMVLSSVYSEMRLAQKKASFVANVSHELKTPLTSISLFIDLLRRNPPAPPAKRSHYLGMMASETERLTRLIDNVLDFSARERGRMSSVRDRVDPARVASEIVESQRVRLESRGFSLTVVAPEGVSEVIADPEALKQVLLNLLSNAEKYSPVRKEIEVSVEKDATVVSLHVRDRGIGIAAKDSERIFREFVRLDESLTARVHGTGLGLTLARRIARDHWGDVKHAPREGGGSDFTVTLPLAAKDGETV